MDRVSVCGRSGVGAGSAGQACSPGTILTSICLLMSKSAVSKMASKSAALSGCSGGTPISAPMPAMSGRSSCLESAPLSSASSSANIDSHMASNVPGASLSSSSRKMSSPSNVADSTTTGVARSPAAISLRTPFKKDANSAGDTSPDASASMACYVLTAPRWRVIFSAAERRG